MKSHHAEIKVTIDKNVYILVDNVVIATIEPIFGEPEQQMKNAEKIIKIWNKTTIKKTTKKPLKR